jgi:SNF2 family DNA or RNA helicase
LSPSLPPDRVRALVSEVEAWVASGAAIPGSVRVRLRVLEPLPDEDEDDWALEVLVQDHLDTAIVAPIGEVFAGSAVFGPAALEDALTALGRAVRLAPELRPLGEQAVPSVMALDRDGVIELVRHRLGPLADIGVAVWLPHWWQGGSRLGLKAKATSRSTSETSVTAAGLGMDELVSFSWAAALGDEELSREDLEELTQASLTKQRLLRFRGQWIEVDPRQVEALLARVGREEEATAGDLLRAGLGLSDLDVGDDIDVVGVEATGWLGQLLDEAVTQRVEPVVAPPGFAGELRPYQQRGVGWLAFLGPLGLGGCLADDMGLGKTAQLIATMLADPAPGPTLVVCPVSVLGNWQREIERFAPELSVQLHHGPERCRHDADLFADQAASCDVTVTTDGLLHRDRELLEAARWGRVVLDEAQQIKNSATKGAQAARALVADRRVALTGTPVENRLAELWSIMQFLNPGLLGSAASFRERFARPIEVDLDDEATARLARVTTPFILRRLKSDRSIITDLPDKIETVDQCPLTREQVSLYQSVVDDLLARAEEAEGMARRGLVLAGIMRLKQVCNHPAHFLGDGSSLAGRSGKLRRTEELLEEIVAAGDKTLVFTQFTAWGDRLGPYLGTRLGIEHWWLHGGVSRAARDEMVAAFADSSRPALLLLSVKAGGTGLNLTAANHVIHFDRWWNPAVEDQATDRAYRIGQDRTVQVHKLVSAGSIEERIDEVITGKRRLAERVVGGGEEWLTELTTDELADVLALAPGVAG